MEIESQSIVHFSTNTNWKTKQMTRWIIKLKGREICSNEKKINLSIDFNHSAFYELSKNEWIFQTVFFFVKWFWPKKLTRSNLKCSSEKFRNFMLAFFSVFVNWKKILGVAGITEIWSSLRAHFMTFWCQTEKFNNFHPCDESVKN
jgi:hypothetical protein